MLLYTTLLLIWSFPVALAAVQGNSQCMSGGVVCCNSVKNANDVPSVPSVTGMSAADAAKLGLVGSTCTTLTVIGQGKSCATKQVPVCCMDNNYDGTLSLGCSYIDLIVT